MKKSFRTRNISGLISPLLEGSLSPGLGILSIIVREILNPTLRNVADTCPANQGSFRRDAARRVPLPTIPDYSSPPALEVEGGRLKDFFTQ